VNNLVVPEIRSWVTDLGTGFDGADVSEFDPNSRDLGWNTNASTVHIADSFTVPPGQRGPRPP